MTNVIELSGVHPSQDIVGKVGDFLSIVLDGCDASEKRNVLVLSVSQSEDTVAFLDQERGPS